MPDMELLGIITQDEIEWLRSELILVGNLDLDEEWAKHWGDRDPDQESIEEHEKFWIIQRRKVAEA